MSFIGILVLLNNIVIMDVFDGFTRLVYYGIVSFMFGFVWRGW